jgi:hypothetical protein
LTPEIIARTRDRILNWRNSAVNEIYPVAEALVHILADLPDTSVREKLKESAAAELINLRTVMQKLTGIFSPDQIVAGITAVLDDAVKIFAEKKIPDEHFRLLMTSCIRLSVSPEGITISGVLAKQIVATFDAGYCFSFVREVIQRYLTDLDVLEAIEPSLQLKGGRNRTISAIQGLRLYSGVATREADRSRYRAAVDRVVLRLSELKVCPDGEISSEARSALFKCEHFILQEGEYRGSSTPAKGLKQGPDEV